MTTRYLFGLAMLFITAAIWGVGFVFQREGMGQIGPFTFNTARFIIGALSVIPVIFLFSKKTTNDGEAKTTLIGGILAGLVLFVGISLQQIGLVHTSAGKAAFITGMYIVFVPVIGVFLGQKIGGKVWIAGIIAVLGLYLLSVTDQMRFAQGDGIVLIGAVFWAFQVLVTAHYSQKINGPKFAFVQFATVAILSLPFALILETVTLDGLIASAEGLLFTGIVATGIAITLQILAQARVPSTQAAMIMSLETVFGAFSGWLFLNEILSSRMLMGAGLMLLGIVIAQLPGLRKQKPIRWSFRRKRT
jgi:drug/metabolite transporter (DMT)-like permease